ncbi:hypothetical protein EYF80_038875 [Liparis tanakae]|uniref:Uncharacterized protein n=1 Tax=Liparis tanakae TaxID=230148 RepID=A0A4Z2GE41_9TELE|nr:hypothetical protein EYF80_038875 [Liparis tanakae]
MTDDRAQAHLDVCVLTSLGKLAGAGLRRLRRRRVGPVVHQLDLRHAGSSETVSGVLRGLSPLHLSDVKGELRKQKALMFVLIKQATVPRCPFPITSTREPTLTGRPPPSELILLLPLLVV